MIRYKSERFLLNEKKKKKFEGTNNIQQAMYKTTALDYISMAKYVVFTHY